MPRVVSYSFGMENWVVLTPDATELTDEATALLDPAAVEAGEAA
jgi:hypothetical protein